MGKQIGKALKGHNGVVNAVALGEIDGARNVSTILRQPAFEFKLGFSAFGLAG